MAPGLKPVVLPATIVVLILPVFAGNTAIIDSYHVFLARSRIRFLPRFVERRNHWRGTPHRAVLLAMGIPLLILW